MKNELIGDPHNFGRHSYAIGSKWISKSRPILWESIFLSNHSEFRCLLDKILKKEPIIECLPRLSFKKSTVDPHQYYVEKLLLTTPRLNRSEIPYALEAFGGMIALACFFGMDDLHIHNLLFGIDKRNGRLTLAPIDIETIFNKISSPTETWIITKEKNLDKMAGIQPVLPFLKLVNPNEKLAIAWGYFSVARKMVKNRTKITNAIQNIPDLKTTPIRVSFRSTYNYKNSQFSKKLLKEEVIQLKRKDTPYFFRSIGQPNVQYYTTPDLGSAKEVKINPLIQEQLPVLMNAKTFLHNQKRNNSLLNYGTHLLIDYFLPRSFSGTLKYKGLSVQAQNEYLFFKARNMHRIQGPRNWTTFLA